MKKIFQLLGLTSNQAQSSVKSDVELDTSKDYAQSHSSSLNVDKPRVYVFDELDEEFAFNFTKQGGKFMFCLSKKSLYLSINYVLEQNGWNAPFISETGIEDLLNENSAVNCTKDHINADVFISSCDNLIATDGRVMVSSNQCKGLNFSELPNNQIIIANHDQIVSNLGEGLRRINTKYFRNLPSKITTIKNINSSKNGKSPKNIYVFLLEDY